jgi:hypothetical protein
VLLDGASERTFIRADLARSLSIPYLHEEELTVRAFGGSVKKTVSNRLKFTLEGDNGFVMEVEASEVPQICEGIPWWDQGKIEAMLDHGSQACTREFAQQGERKEAEILVGADCYWRFVTGHMKRLGLQTMAIQTVFGWTLLGQIGGPSSSASSVAVCTVLTSPGCADQQLQQFVRTDDLRAVKEKGFFSQTVGKPKVTRCMEHSTKTVQLQQGSLKQLIQQLQSYPELSAQYAQKASECCFSTSVPKETVLKEKGGLRVTECDLRSSRWKQRLRQKKEGPCEVLKSVFFGGGGPAWVPTVSEVMPSMPWIPKRKHRVFFSWIASSSQAERSLMHSEVACQARVAPVVPSSPAFTRAVEDVCQGKVHSWSRFQERKAPYRHRAIGCSFNRIRSRRDSFSLQATKQLSYAVEGALGGNLLFK